MSQNPHVPPNAYPPGYPPAAYAYPPQAPHGYPPAPHGYGYGYPPNPAYPPAPGYGYPPAMPGYGYPPQMPAGVAPQAPPHAAPVAPVTAVAPAFVPFTPNPEDAAQIETWFQELDKDYDGYIGGADVVPFFQRSNVNKPILRDLWNLIDYHKNGRLDRKQFIIAIRMLAVLCSPVYMGSKPTIELFNTTVNKPIALPPQMFQSATATPPLPATAATSVSTTAVASTSMATPSTAAEPSQASVFPTVVQDAPLPPLQSAPVPAPTPAPTPTAAIPPHGPPHGYYPGYPGHPPAAGPSYGYPPVATPYGGYHSPVPPPAPVPQPVTVTDDEDEFSDFNAAPSASTSSTAIQAPVPQAAAKAPVTTASLPPMETDGPWEFVSAQPTPIPSSTHSPIPSSASQNQLPVMPNTATTTVSSSHSAANISMLSFDFEDVSPPKPTLAATASATATATAVPTMTAPVTTTATAAIPSSSTDDAFEFDDFQQAATTAGPASHPPVSTIVPPVPPKAVEATPSLPSASAAVPTPAATIASSAMSASASRLAVLDEIIEEDLRMAANEDWDDFESAPTQPQSQPQPQPPVTAATQAAVSSTDAPSASAVSDNPFDLIGDDFEPMPVPTSTSIAAPSLLPTSTATATTIAVAPSVSVMVDDVDEEDEDFGDFASHEPSPVPSKPSRTVATDDATSTTATATATAPTEEDDPFADADFHQATGVDGAPAVPTPVVVVAAAAVSVDAAAAIAPPSNDGDAAAVVEEDDPFAEIAFEAPPPVATAQMPIADSAIEATTTANAVAQHEEDPFSEADFQAPATVASSAPVESSSGTDTAAMTMMKKAPSLDLLDLDFGPVVESAPLPPLMMSTTATSATGATVTATELNISTPSGSVTTLPSTNKKVDLMDLLDNVYGAPTTAMPPVAAKAPTTVPAPVAFPAAAASTATSTNAFGDEDDDDFDPFVAAPSTQQTTSTVDVNAAFGDDNDDDDDDFEPFQSTTTAPASASAPAASVAVKSTDVLLSSVAASTSAVTSIAVADFDPFATGQDTAAIDDDDFFAAAPPSAAASVKPPSSTSLSPPPLTNSSSGTIAKPATGKSSAAAPSTATAAARGTTATPATKSPSSSSSSSFVYKTALTTSELEALATVLAKKHLYDEAYACAKQASVLRTIASLSEAKNIALEEDDLDTAQSINQETHVWMSQLASSAMERHWQYMAQDSKRQGASLDETYENLTFMDATLAKKFHQKFLTAMPTSSSDIRTADGTKYLRPHAKISLELTMKYHVLAKRSARMVMAITSSHRQHVAAWKQALEMCTKMLQEQDRVWQSVFGPNAATPLTKAEQQALATATETRQKFIDPLVAVCETALWVSATCQESLVHEEEARRLWRVAQPLLMVIDDILHLKNKYARMSLEDLTVAAGELSECTGHVTYCNFTLRPLRARYVVKNDTDQEETPITYYPHVKRDGGIEYALPVWNLWHRKLQVPLPASDGLFM